MLWDAASCRVMRMTAISAYCDDRGPNLELLQWARVIVEPDHTRFSF